MLEDNNNDTTIIPMVNDNINSQKIVDEIEAEIKAETDLKDVRSVIPIEELNLVEPKELTEEEKRLNLIEAIKQSKIRFKNTVHNGNVTVSKFDAEYRKKRQRKNKMAKASRKANRK